MTIDATRPARHHHLTTVFNFRDLGGYRGRAGQTVRWAVLFRSDGLNRVDTDDLARLEGLGIATVIDLRTERELTERGRFPASPFVQFHHLPLLARTWDEEGLAPDDPDDAIAFLAARYVAMLEDGSPAVADALGVLAGTTSPAVFHCAAGKDRTGVLAAVVLGLLGVDDEAIAGDYHRSADAVATMVAWMRANRPGALDAMTDQPPAYLAAPPPAMHRLLDHVRAEHGSMVGYVRGLGVELELVEALHEHLLV